MFPGPSTATGRLTALHRPILSHLSPPSAADAGLEEPRHMGSFLLAKLVIDMTYNSYHI